MHHEPTVDELVAEGRDLLRRAPHGPSPREAFLLLGHVLGWSEAEVRARGERVPTVDEASIYRELLRRRAGGEPVAYLTGRREFYGREFLVDSRVLVPRPETEHLVEAVLELDLPERPRILDVGTGSGCIAVTLDLETDDAVVVATDLSPGALDVARANARRLGAAVSFVAADLVGPLRLGAFDVVASNPPYVADEMASTLSFEVVDHEPHLALFAPSSGTSVLEKLFDAARDLRPGAYLVVEIGHDQGEWVEEAAAARAALELVELRRDWAGKPRTAILRRLG